MHINLLSSRPERQICNTYDDYEYDWNKMKLFDNFVVRSGFTGTGEKTPIRGINEAK